MNNLEKAFWDGFAKAAEGENTQDPNQVYQLMKARGNDPITSQFKEMNLAGGSYAHPTPTGQATEQITGGGPSTYRDTNRQLDPDSPPAFLSPGIGYSPQQIAQHYIQKRQNPTPKPILQQQPSYSAMFARNRVNPGQANPRRGSAMRTSS
jgi:hypothetical protein